MALSSREQAIRLLPRNHLKNCPLDHHRAREWINLHLSESPDADFFLDTNPYVGNIEEVLDQQTLDLIDNLIMTTNTLTKVDPTYGIYTENATGYTATFTEVGSNALESISLDNDTLTVVFRSGNSGAPAYTYNITSEALGPLYNEIVNVLQEGEGSIGKVFNQLVRDNKIQLI